MDIPGQAVTCESERARARAWLSEGLETLWQGPPAADARPPFDVLIVGSGYGGAVAAAELAGAKNGKGETISVCVLERGNEYLAGAFPSRIADLAGHVRFSTPEATAARGVRTGLFDVRVGNDVSALVASGLGGGSLINAGVMLAPHPSVFQESRWPADIRAEAADHAAWDTLFADAAELLGAAPVAAGPAPFAKLAALETLGAAATASVKLVRPPITLALHDRPSTDGVAMKACIGCGDCATGCNHGAKESLDLNLLARARRHGAQIFTGATVLKLVRCERSYESLGQVHLVHPDDKLRRRAGAPLVLLARKVILAAGTFGSTEILLRSETTGADTPRLFSALLGARFSANGDMIEAAYGMNDPANCIADDSQQPAARGVGPTITGMIDARSGNPQTDVVAQELSVPGGLRRLFEESFTLAQTLNTLASADTDNYSRHDAQRDRCAVDPRAIQRTLVLALIGRDSADGRLRLNRGDPGKSGKGGDAGDGAVTVDWPKARDDPRLAAHHDTLARWLAASKQGGQALSNPLWRLLPPQLEPLLGKQRGPLLSVHPLGGCTMGDSAASGVVNHLGQVFDGRAGIGTHPGLVVLDGSIVPTSLGINPALTITVLALRAVHALRSLWGFSGVVADTQARARPMFREIETVTAPTPTRVELIERTQGTVTLRNDAGELLPYSVELTLCFAPKNLNELTFEPMADETPAARQQRRSLTLDPARSRLRISREGVNPQGQPIQVQLEATLRGRLALFGHEASVPIGRTLSALPVWFLNRGLRDGAQWLFDRLAGNDPDKTPMPDIGNVARLASRAGDARRLDYALTIGKVTTARHDFARAAPRFENQPLHTFKRLSYGVMPSLAGLRDLLARQGPNPWQQMTKMTITRMPALQSTPLQPPVLSLQLPYLAEQQVPLLHLLDQQDHPAALVDLASFALYFMRILIQVHTWSFRKPDASPARAPQRLPGVVPGLPPPEVIELCTGAIPADAPGFAMGAPVMIRLTRYRRPEHAKPPVLLIHGYSASGTSFAHPALPCSLAQHLCDEGRDVWIVDLRSSAGMATASYPWSFEQIGFADIPLAAEHIVRAAGAAKIDIVAHCMGSAMLWMALLGDTASAHSKPLPHDTASDARKALPGRIRKLAMSQIGPAMVMAPENIFRAYLMRYVQQFLPLTDYSFQTAEGAGVVNTLLDRVLSTLPYPAGEFQLENPFWPPGKRTSWVGTRHRMDALYGRVFKLANMPEAVLEHLNDFFGPLNIQTVSQVIHFTRNHCITDRTGFNCYVDPLRISTLKFPMLSLHGSENGLADPRTLKLLESVFLNNKFSAVPIDGHGHQDCLLGRDAKAKVFVEISNFLDAKGPYA